jgi:hypothetical protein
MFPPAFLTEPIRPFHTVSSLPPLPPHRSWNGIGDDGALAIAAALQSFTSLETLDLRCVPCPGYEGTMVSFGEG